MSRSYRDITLGQIGEADIGRTVRAAGWVENIRDHGGVSFLDLRDMYAVLQVVVRDGKLLEGIRKEQAVSIQGMVEKRGAVDNNIRLEPACHLDCGLCIRNIQLTMGWRIYLIVPPVKINYTAA